MRRLLRLLLALAAIAIGGVLPAAAPLAAQSATITMVTDPTFHLKHNGPCAGGPEAAYVGFRITNTSGVPITNARATGTPTGGFTLGGVAGREQPATFYLGTLGAGESRMVYWFVSAPCTLDVTGSFGVSVSADNFTGSTSATILTKGSIQANAGGQLTGTLLGPGAIVGQTIHFDASYSFGGNNVGETYSMQPVGNSDFAAACFQFMRSEIVASVSVNVPVGTVDELYFVAHTRENGSGYTVTVRYYFKYLCTGLSSPAKAYATQQSGSTNLKYSGNYDTYVGHPTMPVATNPFVVSFGVTPTLLSTGGDVTYTLGIENPSTLTATIDSVAVDLPAGAVFVGVAAGSDIAAANSSLAPAPGASGRLVWRGNPGVSYESPAGSTLNLVITVTIPATAGAHAATGSGYTGSTVLGSATATVQVGADVAVTLAGPATAAVGAVISYAVTTRNDGPAPATGVVPRVTLPAGVTFAAATNGGADAGGAVEWPAIASLAAGAERVDTVRVVITAPGTVEFAASATATSVDGTVANHDGSAAAARVETTATAALSVSVSPQGGVTVLRLPGGAYTESFVVHNTAWIAGDFVLTPSSAASAGFLTVTGLSGPGLDGGAGGGTVTIPAQDSVTVVVSYTVTGGEPADETLQLHAAAADDSAIESIGSIVIRRALPSMTIYRSVSTGTALPGGVVTHTIEVENIGEMHAYDVVVTDSVPAAYLLELGSLLALLPAGVTADVSFTADGGGWGYAPVSGGCGAPAGFDGCVRGIRWSLAQPLAGPAVAGGPAGGGVLSWSARVR
jgi:uncharacterized repeat protein (TIGR01451 family)